MTNRRRTATVAGVTALVGGAVTATVFTLMPASAASFHDSAFGVAGTGAEPFGARPTADSANGGQVSNSLASFSSSDNTIQASGMSVMAEGDIHHALATVQKVTLFNAVTLTNARAECHNAAAISSVTVSGSAQNVTVDKNVQTVNADHSRTVVAAVVHLTTVGGDAQTVYVASATCDAGPAQPPTTTTAPTTAPPTTSPTSTPPPTTSPTTPAPTATPTAPVPTPTSTHLPVTH